jgi:hypothetical protein
MEKRKFLDLFVLSGVAFVPEDAKTTRIYLEDGSTFMMPYQVRTLLNWIHRYFGTDPVQMKKNYSEILGNQYMVPFVFTESWAIVPLKVVRNGEKMQAWFLTDAIRAFHEKEKTLEMQGDHVISVYESKESFSSQMRKVKLCQYYLHAFQRRLKRKPSFLTCDPDIESVLIP